MLRDGRMHEPGQHGRRGEHRDTIVIVEGVRDRADVESPAARPDVHLATCVGAQTARMRARAGPVCSFHVALIDRIDIRRSRHGT